MFVRLVTRVFRAPQVFFETTPIGRILSRFTFDVDVIDQQMIVQLVSAVASAFWMLSSLVIISLVQPWMLLVLLPVLLLFRQLLNYYERSCIELQRLDSIS